MWATEATKIVNSILLLKEPALRVKPWPFARTILSTTDCPVFSGSGIQFLKKISVFAASILILSAYRLLVKSCLHLIDRHRCCSKAVNNIWIPSHFATQRFHQSKPYFLIFNSIVLRSTATHKLCSCESVLTRALKKRGKQKKGYFSLLSSHLFCLLVYLFYSFSLKHNMMIHSTKRAA